MKKLSTAGRFIFWLAIIFTITFLVRAESGGNRTSASPQKQRGAPGIRIVDQNGEPAVSGVPSDISTIVDVTVGPGFSFSPPTVNISVGDTVRWTWAGDGHSVTSGQPCQADSQYCSPNDMNCFPGVLSNTGTVYTHTFTRSGTYSYFCLSHCFFGMTGVVNVSGGCAPSGWSAGSNMPSVGVRSVGVYFPANGKFYAMGGRSSDIAGSDFTHPFEYDPSANSWTTKSATYPDNQVNNMACGVLAESGTPYIYCVGGSAAGAVAATARVFRYNPVTDAITTLAIGDNWPGDASGTILPGGFTVYNNKLYILGGFNINVASTNQIWQFDPTLAVGSKWLQRVNAPMGVMYAPTCTIGNIIHLAGASDYQGGTVVDTTNSFSFNPISNTIGTIAPIPRATGETRGLTFNGKMLVMGGGRVAPNPSNEVDAYDPVANTWAMNVPVPAFATARRNFPTDTDGTTRIWLAGGYAPAAPTDSTERFCVGGASPTPTPTATPTATATATRTPTATPTATAILTPTATATATRTPTATPTAAGTATPTATPTCGTAAWQPGPAQPPARYALQAALGTDNMLYIAGGGSADNMTFYNQVSRYNYTTNAWSNVAPLPVPLSQGTMGAWNGKIYVAGGFLGGTTVTNALRIYDIATNTWTSGANMPTSPGVEAAAGAVVNGKFYVMGGDDFNNGLNTNFIYDIATNTWTTGATLPDNRTNTYGTAVNGLIYVYGGFILPGSTTDSLLRYDPVANSWTNLGSAGTAGRGNYGGISPFGTGQLLITDGADAMFNPTNATHIFTISSGTFSAGLPMLGNRAGHAQGTLPDGRVLVADGLDTASTGVSTVELLTNPPCPSATPTPTPTATATATRTPTATPTATTTPAATPTGTPSITPRPAPTPRARPTTPPPRP